MSYTTTVVGPVAHLSHKVTQTRLAGGAYAGVAESMRARVAEVATCPGLSTRSIVLHTHNNKIRNH